MKGMFDGWTEAHVFAAWQRQGRGVIPEDLWGGVEPVNPIVLVLPWPPTGNHRLIPVIRKGKLRQVKNPVHVAYSEECQQAIGRQHRGYAPLTGRLQAHFELYPWRDCDDDNFIKGIRDDCTAMKVWGDDKQVYRTIIDKFPHNEQPYVKLTISRLT